jgi:hypothetical protein
LNPVGQPYGIRASDPPRTALQQRAPRLRASARARRLQSRRIVARKPIDDPFSLA